MERSSSRMRTWIGHNARRSLWALLIAIHLPIIASVAKTLFFGSENGSWLAFISLILTIGVFVLKLFDVPCLRFRTRQNGAIVFIVACLFIHYEVAASEVSREVLQQAPMALGVGAIAIGVLSSSRRMRDIWRSFIATLSHRLILTHSHGTVISEPPSSTRWLINSLLTGPRAPPA